MAGNIKFGKRLRELREAKLKNNPKFTLRKFAESVGISPTFLSKVERGEFDPPKAEKIIKMAELLEIDSDELLSLAGKVDPELEKIIKEQPTALPDLLRTVRGMSEAELRRLTQRARDKEDG
ncbi:MAG: helix-turn-helix transcriptional regulator [Desulfatitalea sp.]|nr:helix-turn-helix domain-containing protein [Desulfatitalea sp.]NNK00117.1 helix-turn-helix transcriptional regulator [Desulfatitalea sp.]